MKHTDPIPLPLGTPPTPEELAAMKRLIAGMSDWKEALSFLREHYPHLRETKGWDEVANALCARFAGIGIARKNLAAVVANLVGKHDARRKRI